MSLVSLARFENDWYHPGRTRIIQIAWYFFGLPLLRSSWIPISVVKGLLLRVFGAQVGRGVIIKPGVRVKYPWRLSIGDHCWIGEDCWIDNLANVTLEDDVCLSQGVYLCTGNHDWNDPAFGLKIGTITIDSGSWIGAKSIILPGVSVKTGGVALAGSVVVRDIPEWQIHGGNPAVFKKVRRLGSGVTGKELLPIGNSI